MLDAARETLVGHAGRPVGAVPDRDRAQASCRGIEELIAEALAAAEAAAPTDPARRGRRARA